MRTLQEPCRDVESKRPRWEDMWLDGTSTSMCQVEASSF